MFIKFRQPLGLPLLDKTAGCPEPDGEYMSFGFHAQAVRRKSRYADEDLRYNSNEPMRLSISIDSRELGATAHRIIGEYEIPDDRVIEIEHRVWLEKGFTFHVHWANGPNGSFKRILRKVLPKYNKDALYPIRNPPEMYVGSGPELARSHFGDRRPILRAMAARWIRSVLSGARRGNLTPVIWMSRCCVLLRPPSDVLSARAEMEPYLDLAREYFAKHGDFWAAAKYGVRAILTSPNFLYLAETTPSDSKERKVSDHELATRLSYFLWSSMPDDQLRAAADRGVLSETERLAKRTSSECSGGS